MLSPHKILANPHPPTTHFGPLTNLNPRETHTVESQQEQKKTEEKIRKTEEKEERQAGAELCQAQVKLRLANLDLLSQKLGSSSLCWRIGLFFQMIEK